MFSVLLALITIIFLYKATEFFFKEELYRLYTLFFAVTLPQFCFISGMITNDNLSILISTFAVFLILKYMQSPGSIKNVFLLGVVLALGLITKKTFLFIIPVFIIINVILAAKTQISLKKVILNFSIILLIVLLISGWWYYRNFTLYGEFFLTKTEMITAPFHVQLKPLFSYYFINPFIPGMYGSFIGVFGWMNMPLPVFSYFVYFFFFAVSIYGIIKTFPLLMKLPNYIYILMLFVFCFGGIVYYNTMYSQYQGRFLFPVISCVSILLITGFKYMETKYFRLSKYRYIPGLFASLIILTDAFSIIKVLIFYYDQSYYIN